MKKLLLFMLFPVLAIGQTAIPFSFNGEVFDDQFSTSISLSKDGTTLAVGSPNNDAGVTPSLILVPGPTAGTTQPENNDLLNRGHVRVYRKNASGVWAQIGADIDGESPNDGSGNSVSLSTDGNTLAIGASAADRQAIPTATPPVTALANCGHVRVYTWNGTLWVQKGADINGEAAGNSSGTAVSISGDGNVVAIGAISNDPPNPAGGGVLDKAGHVRVWQFNSTTSRWALKGGEINGLAANDFFGNAVSLSTDGNTVLAGSNISTGGGVGTNAGQARVFKFDAVTSIWELLGTGIFNGEAAQDQCSRTVAISGDGKVLAIGAVNNDGPSTSVTDNRGHVRLYKLNSTSDGWIKIGDDIDGEASTDQSSLGLSISENGDTVAIGAPGNDVGVVPDVNNLALQNTGSVRVYKNVNGTWTQLGNDIDGPAAGDASGRNVSLSADGKTLAVGAAQNDAGGNNAGTVRLWDLTNAVLLSSDSFVLANFSVYPNPASDVVTISLQEGLQFEKVNIYNTLGQLVKAETTNVIAVNTFAKGGYFFEVISNKGKATKKILVK